MREALLAEPKSSPLVDPFGRTINYLRLSVTDRCNLRCFYCVSPTVKKTRNDQVLSLEELEQLADVFIGLGITKIRITGGEPLVRRNIIDLIANLGAHPGLNELTLTTNGTELPRYAETLRQAGVERINISLDSLDAARFLRRTGTGRLSQVLKGIEAARSADFKRIKLNTVISQGDHELEIPRLVAFAAEHGLDLSFIEQMPIGGDRTLDATPFVTADQILQRLTQEHTLTAVATDTGGPSRYYQLDKSSTLIGFISPRSKHFCDSCNRVRVTATGQLIPCLGNTSSFDLRAVLRTSPDTPHRLENAIRSAIAHKPRGHDFDGSHPLHAVLPRPMNLTGG